MQCAHARIYILGAMIMRDNKSRFSKAGGGSSPTIVIYNIRLYTCTFIYTQRRFGWKISVLQIYNTHAAAAAVQYLIF